MTATISITDKGKTITYHAHHMRDVIAPIWAPLLALAGITIILIIAWIIGVIGVLILEKFGTK